ncbi:uncharacterized protein LOC116168514 [Photinus pyralis]|uniref:uncharacterized protein LOC116168514 n=1 Tax=Photinus pyralis TaxID=7054 RepID=UPI0012672B7D|nr:uncharacterized protein LOC116168514 [Photinus pyralis]
MYPEFLQKKVVPEGAPVVSVDRGGLERGGPLIADCAAPPSSPAPNITWYVNDQRVPGSTSTSVKVDEDHLESATSRLELTGVGGSWGTIRLRCEASLFRLYKANSLELEVKPDAPTPQPASVLLMGPSMNGQRYLLSSGLLTQTSFVLVLFRWSTQTVS